MVTAPRGLYTASQMTVRKEPHCAIALRVRRWSQGWADKATVVIQAVTCFNSAHLTFTKALHPYFSGSKRSEFIFSATFFITQALAASAVWSWVATQSLASYLQRSENTYWDHLTILRSFITIYKALCPSTKPEWNIEHLFLKSCHSEDLVLEWTVCSTDLSHLTI